ncbi:DUF2303 family protein [Thermosyntropha sp.]|uniref:DUF2303 family protein n=1 Tax=Thermosyntropha sp. TaxID=2740820 RepID=UPI0025EDAF26|nr:DUF2303 family protein [Thermosyntropha sp.]MBO8158849.1 DUF2303 family protein [Thermosyntropha sp.]
MNNEHLHVKVEEGVGTLRLIKANEYNFPGTNYRLDSTQAVIDLVLSKGKKDNTVIFYDENIPEIQIILDDSIMDRPQDKAFYPFRYSDLFSEWAKLFDTPVNQKQFIDFLKRRDVVECPEAETLLVTTQRLRLAQQIIGEYSYDDNNNITCMFKTKTGEDIAKLPSVFTIHVPIFNKSDNVMDIEVEMELTIPKTENEKPLFMLSCPKLPRYKKQAVAYEINVLQKRLPGFLIIPGALKN